MMFYGVDKSRAQRIKKTIETPSKNIVPIIVFMQSSEMQTIGPSRMIKERYPHRF